MLPNDLRWRENVGLRTHKRHTAVLAVHEELSSEALAQQVLGCPIIDCAVNAGDHPDRVAILQIL